MQANNNNYKPLITFDDYSFGDDPSYDDNNSEVFEDTETRYLEQVKTQYIVNLMMKYLSRGYRSVDKLKEFFFEESKKFAKSHSRNMEELDSDVNKSNFDQKQLNEFEDKWSDIIHTIEKDINNRKNTIEKLIKNITRDDLNLLTLLITENDKLIKPAADSKMMKKEYDAIIKEFYEEKDTEASAEVSYEELYFLLNILQIQADLLIHTKEISKPEPLYATTTTTTTTITTTTPANSSFSHDRTSSSAAIQPASILPLPKGSTELIIKKLHKRAKIQGEQNNTHKGRGGLRDPIVELDLNEISATANAIYNHEIAPQGAMTEEQQLELAIQLSLQPELKVATAPQLTGEQEEALAIQLSLQEQQTQPSIPGCGSN